MPTFCLNTFNCCFSIAYVINSKIHSQIVLAHFKPFQRQQPRPAHLRLCGAAAQSFPGRSHPCEARFYLPPHWTALPLLPWAVHPSQISIVWPLPASGITPLLSHTQHLSTPFSWSFTYIDAALWYHSNDCLRFFFWRRGGGSCLTNHKNLSLTGYFLITFPGWPPSNTHPADSKHVLE